MMLYAFFFSTFLLISTAVQVKEGGERRFIASDLTGEYDLFVRQGQCPEKIIHKEFSGLPKGAYMVPHNKIKQDGEDCTGDGFMTVVSKKAIEAAGQSTDVLKTGPIKEVIEELEKQGTEYMVGYELKQRNCGATSISKGTTVVFVEDEKEISIPELINLFPGAKYMIMYDQNSTTPCTYAAMSSDSTIGSTDLTPPPANSTVPAGAAPAGTGSGSSGTNGGSSGTAGASTGSSSGEASGTPTTGSGGSSGASSPAGGSGSSSSGTGADSTADRGNAGTGTNTPSGTTGVGSGAGAGAGAGAGSGSGSGSGAASGAGSEPSTNGSSSGTEGGGGSGSAPATAIPINGSATASEVDVDDTGGSTIGGIAEEGIEPSASPEEAGGSVCFSADGIVTLENGATRRMDEIEIGDRVSVGNGEYSEVFMFTNRVSSKSTKFIRLKTKSGASVELTPGHYIYSNHVLVPGSSVKIGDLLTLADGTSSEVEKVTSLIKTGVYNPQTSHGDIVVNGIRASTFTTTVYPDVAQSLLAPLRAAFHSIGLTCNIFNNGASKLAKIVSGM